MMMGVLLDSSLYSMPTLIGFVWTVAVFYLLYTEKGNKLSSSKWLLLAIVPAVYFAVPTVAAEVDALTLLAGGVKTLDGHIGYGSADITVFAEALGAAGRQHYAYFQFGLDTLAPPAFAGLMISVGRSTVSFIHVRKLLTVLVSIYFLSVLFANALMPIYMLNYPEQNGFLSVLYVLLPVLDGVKYATHAVVWLIIMGCWIAWAVNRFILKSSPLDASAG